MHIFIHTWSLRHIIVDGSLPSHVPVSLPLSLPLSPRFKTIIFIRMYIRWDAESENDAFRSASFDTIDRHHFRRQSIIYAYAKDRRWLFPEHIIQCDTCTVHTLTRTRRNRRNNHRVLCFLIRVSWLNREETRSGALTKEGERQNERGKKPEMP